jgi:hypothetical protein
MKYTHFSIVLLLSIVLAVFAVAQTHIHEHSKLQTKSDTSHVKDIRQKIVKENYTCTMDPEVISDKPGKCPKCGMKLVKMKPSSVIIKSHKMQKDTTKIRLNKIH